MRTTGAAAPPTRPAAMLFALLAALFVLCLPVGAQPAPEGPPVMPQADSPGRTITWLLIPVQDLSGQSAPLAQAVTEALVKELQSVPGWQVWVHDPQADPIRKAIGEGLLTESEALSIPDLRTAQRLGLIRGANTALAGLLLRKEETVSLLLNAVGTLGRQTAGPGRELDIPIRQVKMTPGLSPASLAASLVEGARDRLLSLTQQDPRLWAVKSEYAPAWLEEGDKSLAMGHYRDARLAFLAAVTADPSSPVSRRKLAQTLLLLGDADKARQELEEALRLAPNDGEVLLALGEVQLALGNPGRAAGYFDSAALFLKDDPRPKEGLARTYLARGDVNRARQEYEQLLVRSPQTASLHRGYGQALLQANQPRLALDEFRQALALAPDDRVARQAFANLLLAQGKLTEGIRELRLLSDKAERPLLYPPADYARTMRYLADEFEATIPEFDQRLSQFWEGAISQAQFLEFVRGLHQRSDNLARLYERIVPPQDFDRSHRYWVLAANYLNQSDFEASRYADNEGSQYLQRSQLFRLASRRAAEEARTLAAAASPQAVVARPSAK